MDEREEVRLEIEVLEERIAPCNTHFNPQGAKVMARLAADGIRELRLKLVRLMRSQSETAEYVR